MTTLLFSELAISSVYTTLTVKNTNAKPSKTNNKILKFSIKKQNPRLSVVLNTEFLNMINGLASNFKNG